MFLATLSFIIIGVIFIFVSVRSINMTYPSEQAKKYLLMIGIASLVLNLYFVIQSYLP